MLIKFRIYKNYKKKVYRIMENNLIHYESILVIDPSLSKEGQKLFFKVVKEIIIQFKGTIQHIDSWGVRKLANKNKKKWVKGLYFHFSFNGGVGVVEEITRRIKMNEKLLYYHFEKLSSKKSPEKHLEDFRILVEESIQKETERLARSQKRKSFSFNKKTGM